MTSLDPGVALVLAPLTVRQWAGMYRQDIRTIVNWQELLNHDPKITPIWFVDKAPDVFYPWAVKGHWMQGAKLRPVALGDNSLIVRAPAVRWKKKTVLLDGCHRTSQLKPKLLILDVVECNDVKIRRCFADLLFDEKGGSK